jgi:hypothetical protein
MSAASAITKSLTTVLCLGVLAAVVAVPSVSFGIGLDPVGGAAPESTGVPTAPDSGIPGVAAEPASTQAEPLGSGEFDETEAESEPIRVEGGPRGLPSDEEIDRESTGTEWIGTGPATNIEDLEDLEQSRVVFEPLIKVNVVSILNRNDDGDHFGFPSAVFCDREMEETFVVTSGGGGRIIVYNENYFPVFSLGAGRGADAPRDIEKDSTGRFYIAQSATENNPSRISVFNAALLKERDIELDQADIERLDEGTFVPQSIAMAPNDRIYIILSNVRGVLVMGTDGTFSHWLRPMDMVYAVGPAGSNEEEEKGSEDAGDEAFEYDIDLSTLPEELRPRRRAEYPSDDVGPKLGPVLASSVRIDSHGNIFVLSAETSKVYVFNSDEELLFTFGEKGGAEGKMSQPRDLVIDENRNAVYIADYMRHTVLIFERSGRFMYEFGGQGNSPGWFQFPVSLALDRQGYLLVSDLFNRRVQVLNVDFKYTFPLFRVPFVQEDAPAEEQPTAWKARQRYYAPGGFDPGRHAASGEDKPDETEDRFRRSFM